MKKLTDFGTTVKIKLLRNGKNQNWLIEEVKKETGLYFDDSYLYKIMVGVNSNKKMISAIKKILEIE